jgi:hypothetical protein
LTDDVAHLKIDNVEFKKISDLQGLAAGPIGAPSSLPSLPKPYREATFGRSQCQQYAIASSVDVSISSVKSTTGTNVDALLLTASDEEFVTVVEKGTVWE